MNALQIAEDLAARLSLRKRRGADGQARSWGGKCPVCDYHGAFWMRIEPGKARPSLYCQGCTREQLTAAAERILLSPWAPTPPADPEGERNARERKKRCAARLFSGSTLVTPEDPAGLYLAHRAIGGLIGSPALRYRADCPHPGGGRLRGLMAQVVSVSGEPVAVHRTFLTPNGRKADVSPAKATLGPYWGGSVRLDPVAPEIVIAEGIETAASAGLLAGLPAWAAISAGNMANALELPRQVRRVTIAADNDAPGRRAAEDAARRWRSEGREVRITTPRQPGADWNDILRMREARDAG